MVVQHPVHAGAETWWDKQSSWTVPTGHPWDTLKSAGDPECAGDPCWAGLTVGFCRQFDIEQSKLVSGKAI